MNGKVNDILVIRSSANSSQNKGITSNFPGSAISEVGLVKDATRNLVNIPAIQASTEISEKIYNLIETFNTKKYRHIDTILISQSVSNLFTIDQNIENGTNLINNIGAKLNNSELNLFIEIKDLDALKREILSNNNLQNTIEEYDIRFINIKGKRQISFHNGKLSDDVIL